MKSTAIRSPALFGLLLFVLAAANVPAAAQAKLTPAEVAAARSAPPFRQFSAWLEAFNSGDQARIRQYYATNYPAANIDNHLRLRDNSGGFDFRTIEQATPTSVIGLIEDRRDQVARYTMIVDSTEPYRIVRLSIQAVPRPADMAIPPMAEGELMAALRTRLEKDAANDRFAGAVIVARLENKTPKVLFSQAYGLADREKNIKNTLDTRFRVGSMNKMFTATAIMQLVQAGKIKLSDPLGKYLTDYPNQNVATKVTIHHLLTHTGGTGDIFGPQFAANRLELRTLNDYVKLYGSRDLVFEPGARWAYSNYGMLLLGVVIERVTGQSYYDYVAEHIFKPAAMTRTGSQPESEAIEGRSVGYMRPQNATSWTPNTPTLPYRGTSAGGGYSTVQDMLKFATALMNNKLLNAENTNLLITGKAQVGPNRMYAYGFEDSRIDGAGAVGHGGGAPGMNGDLRIYPKTGYIVAVLSNLDPPAASSVSTFIDLRLPR